MLTIKKEIKAVPNYSFPGYKKEDILFFDIETTGFSPERTVLYLIGCAYYNIDKSVYELIQWFADDKNSELNMLHSFFSLLNKYKLLVHFNGDGFDIPYVLKKCERFKLNYNFNNIESLDIYKFVSSYKHIFQLDNYKQKTIEKYLDIHREDKYCGGELIQVYANFLKCKMLDLDKNVESITIKELLKMLLLHNSDDIEGLLKVSDILLFKPLFNGESICSIKKHDFTDKDFIIEASLNYPIPKLIRFSNKDMYFSANKSDLTIRVPFYNDELKYFYDNYKDYYYLPKEDTAIHKSVAIYVDKDFKTKAKAANCYIRKTGLFVPQFEKVITPYFKNNYKDTITYIEVNDELTTNNDSLLKYTVSLIKNIKHK